MPGPLPFIEQAIQASYPTILNVGCAEGYYAVGMARRMPNTKVLAAGKAQQLHARNRAGNRILFQTRILVKPPDEIDVIEVMGRAGIVELARGQAQRHAGKRHRQPVAVEVLVGQVVAVLFLELLEHLLNWRTFQVQAFRRDIHLLIPHNGVVGHAHLRE